ncbi:hypothetical protein D4764_09G0010140 [Takifugu flavidus]|uniref:Uncharacterized protein n=1 Tax=Takifugu flavidus TaxID=433684 RepID=A0A5C6ML73_9TELE|nr:hypothetical protein D4764_09G0010140 [Takifugu flavidus]
MGCRLGEWDEQQRSPSRAEKSKPGEQTGTRDAEAEVVVRGRKQVGCPGNRQGRQNEDRQGRRLVLPPAILPSRALCRKGVRASWHWAVGCRLVSVGHDAPAGTPHGVDYLAYWTHCCFGSVLWFGILSLSPRSPLLGETALRRGGAAEATTELLPKF